MRDSDLSELRAIAREIDADPVASENAALCDARRVLSRDDQDGEAAAGEALSTDAPGPLSIRQSRAAQMLATGMSIHEVAAVLGVHRGTIFRWRATHPAFIEAQQQCAARAASELSLVARRLLVKAAGYVDRAMEEEADRGDWAARVLRNRQLWNLAGADGSAS